MAKNLLIVESLRKRKLLKKILGKDFQVKSCFGHIRDLEKAGMGIDLEKNFAPSYIVPDDKGEGSEGTEVAGKQIRRSVAGNG